MCMQEPLRFDTVGQEGSGRGLLSNTMEEYVIGGMDETMILNLRPGLILYGYEFSTWHHHVRGRLRGANVSRLQCQKETKVLGG